MAITTFDPKDPFYTQGYLDPRHLSSMFVSRHYGNRSFIRAVVEDPEATIMQEMSRPWYDDHEYVGMKEKDIPTYAAEHHLDVGQVTARWTNMQHHYQDWVQAAKKDLTSMDVIMPVYADAARYRFGTNDAPVRVYNGYGDGEMYIKILDRDHAEDLDSDAVLHPADGYAFDADDPQRGVPQSMVLRRTTDPLATLGKENARFAVCGYDCWNAPAAWLTGQWNVYGLDSNTEAAEDDSIYNESPIYDEVVLQPISPDAKVLAVTVDYAQVNNPDIPVVTDLEYPPASEVLKRDTQTAKPSITDRIHGKVAALDGGDASAPQY